MPRLGTGENGRPGPGRPASSSVVSRSRPPGPRSAASRVAGQAAGAAFSAYLAQAPGESGLGLAFPQSVRTFDSAPGAGSGRARHNRAATSTVTPITPPGVQPRPPQASRFASAIRPSRPAAHRHVPTATPGSWLPVRRRRPTRQSPARPGPGAVPRRAARPVDRNWPDTDTKGSSRHCVEPGASLIDAAPCIAGGGTREPVSYGSDQPRPQGRAFFFFRRTAQGSPSSRAPARAHTAFESGPLTRPPSPTVVGTASTGPRGRVNRLPPRADQLQVVQRSPPLPSSIATRPSPCRGRLPPRSRAHHGSTPPFSGAPPSGPARRRAHPPPFGRQKNRDQPRRLQARRQVEVAAPGWYRAMHTPAPRRAQLPRQQPRPASAACPGRRFRSRAVAK